MADKGLPLNRYGNRRGMHPNSRANIKPAGEVQSLRFGPAVSLVALLREELTHIPDKALDGEENKERLTNAKLLVKRIMKEAIEGNVSLAREVLDRIDGRSAQVISGPGDSPIEVQQSVRLISQSEMSMALEALLLYGVIQALPAGDNILRIEGGDGDGEEASG